MRKKLLPLFLAGALFLTACGAPAASGTASSAAAKTGSASSVMTGTASDSMASASGKDDSMMSGASASAADDSMAAGDSKSSSPAESSAAVTGKKTADDAPSENPASAQVGNKAGFGVLDSFSTTDLNGNSVDQSILKNAKLTMVNVWGTFCSPCISEMPDLAKLNDAYKDQGFQIIGIPLDTLDYSGNISSAQADKALQIVTQIDANYTHLLPTGNLLAIAQQVIYYPTTMFVDENGQQVGDVFVGARSKAQWEEIIKQYLTMV